MNKAGTTSRWLLAALVTVAAVALSACGGYTTVSLGGGVQGLTNQGLVLSNAGQNLNIAAGATSYVFPNQIPDDGAYNIGIVTQPAHQTCVVSGGSGVATGIAINSATVYCTMNAFTIGGSITGLAAEGLVLTNGGDNLSVVSTATAFTMAGAVQDGNAYGVVVLTQPTGQTCSVANGTGKMGEANVTNIAVTCVNNP